ncbi:MAG: heavy metal translocating P-type ATPase, partial [bacterium]
TQGELQLEDIRLLRESERDEVVSIAAAIERNSPHPMALSLMTAAQGLKLPDATNVILVAGKGVSGEINGQTVCIGSLEYVQQWLNQNSQTHLPQKLQKEIESLSQPAIILTDINGPLALFLFRDKIRPGAAELVQFLSQSGITTSLVSGDRSAPVRYVADILHIGDSHANCKPEEKLRILEQLIDDGKIVSVVGDGINDTPAMGKAHLAVVLARTVNLLSARADMVITGEDLGALIAAKNKAKKTYTIIRQNITWALMYNVCAIPAALAGWVPPWLAGIGMSLSSVIVVLNASRLTGVQQSTQP